MSVIPRERTPDSTLAFLSEGYAFISRRCAEHGSDVFRTRILLRPVYCMRGEEAARVFYHPDRFTRRGAIPPTAMLLLQDRGSAMTLDAEAHRHRKLLFLSLMTPERIAQLSRLFAAAWRTRVTAWERMEQVVLHEEVEALLCRAVCEWAGVPLTEAEVPQRTREFSAMIDGAGAVGPRNWRAMPLRASCERWARGVIEELRAGSRRAPEESAAHAIAMYRGPDGAQLPLKTAAVELINVLRPTVAVARYVTFSALALYEHPAAVERLRRSEETAPGTAVEDPYLTWFVQEVRRYYPFFPAVGGRVREPFEWRGHRFDKGEWVLLDLYGTHRDPLRWEAPDTFRPERFEAWTGSPFDLVPQGGGDHAAGHRCAGEWLTIDLMKTAVRLLVTSMTYEVPSQDLSVDLSRMPAIPKSRFVFCSVRRSG